MSWSFRSKFRSVEIVTGPSLWTSIGWLLLGLFVQSVASPWLGVRNAVPSFTTIVVVLYALRAGPRRGLLVGILAGALTDALAGTAGGWTIADTLVVAFVAAVSGGFFADGIVPPSALVTAAVFLRDGVFWIVMTMEGYPRGFGTRHLHESLWQALITGLCALGYLAYRQRYAGVTTRVERYS